MWQFRSLINKSSSSRGSSVTHLQLYAHIFQGVRGYPQLSFTTSRSALRGSLPHSRVRLSHVNVVVNSLWSPGGLCGFAVWADKLCGGTERLCGRPGSQTTESHWNTPSCVCACVCVHQLFDACTLGLKTKRWFKSFWSCQHWFLNISFCFKRSTNVFKI